MRFCKLGKVFKETYCVLYSRVLRKRWPIYLFFDMHLNLAFLVSFESKNSFVFCTC